MKIDGKNIWVKINNNKINAALDPEYLAILEPLLDRSYSDIPLKDDKFEKSQIYKMTVLTKLYQESFRRELFSLFNSEQLKKLIQKLELSLDTDEKMVSSLLKVPWNNNKQAKILIDFIGVPEFILDISVNTKTKKRENITPWVLKYNEFLDPIQQYLLKIEFANRSFYKILQPYQAIAHQDVLNNIKSKFSRCILNMPTGTGKTRVAMEIVCTFLNKYSTKSVLWIAHTVELIDQAELEFAHLWEFLGNRKIDIVRYSGKKIDLGNAKSAFILTTYQALARNNKPVKSIPIGLILIDEAHMSIAKQWNRSIKEIINPLEGTRIVGLTATPIRTDQYETKKLINFYNIADEQSNLIQLKSIDSTTSIFDQLIAQGILSKPIYEKLQGIDVKLPESLIKNLKENLDYSSEFLLKIARNGMRNLIITRKIKDILEGNLDEEILKHLSTDGIPSNNQQILFFGINVDHSKMITTWLLKNNIPAFHIDSTIDTLSRSTIINAFRNGKIQALCNYGILATGFDVPKINCIFISRPTTSHVLHSQMIGRGLRGPKLGGTPTCYIVEVEDNYIKYTKEYNITFNKYKELWDTVAI